MDEVDGVQKRGRGWGWTGAVVEGVRGLVGGRRNKEEGGYVPLQNLETV
jgi:hypothetical protein